MEFDNKKLAKDLFEEGIEDLESSEILYEKEKYSRAIFLFQQSVEKVTKAFGLLYSLVKEEDLARKISHQSHKVFKKPISDIKDKLQSISEHDGNHLNIFFDLLPDDKKDKLKEHFGGLLDKGVTKFENIDIHGFFHIPDETIDSILKLSDEIQRDKLKLSNDSDPDFLRQKMQSFIGNIKETYGEHDKLDNLMNDTQTLDNIINIINPLNKTVVKVAYVAQMMFALSLITAPHSTKARYYCDDCKTMAKKNYTKELGIIGRYEDLISLYKNVINEFKELLEDESLMNTIQQN